MARRYLPERLTSPFDEAGQIRVAHRLAAADKEECLPDGKELEDRLRVRVVLHRKIGAEPEDDGFRFTEPAMEMEHRVGNYSLDHFLHFIGLQPCDGATTSRVFEQVVVIERCKYSG